MGQIDNKLALIYICMLTGLKIDEFSRAKMDATEKELIEEKALAYSCLHASDHFQQSESLKLHI